ncbi:hypothetical protein MMC18_000990 [Xylographa bjoerkii]|nr:hypothetical protein [Xylographa bjoerkii]
MAGIPDRFGLDFDLYDALGLPPVGEITRQDVVRAWKRVKLHLHPKAIVHANGYVPAFPTYPQAMDAYRYLTAYYIDGNRAEECTRRIGRSLQAGRAAFRSTWNPTAPLGTPEVLQPIPGAANVQTDGPAPPLATVEQVPLPPRADPLGPIPLEWAATGAEPGRRHTAPPAEPPPPIPIGPTVVGRIYTGTNETRRRRTQGPAIFKPPPPDPFDAIVVAQTGDGTNGPGRRRTAPPDGSKPPPPKPLDPIVVTDLSNVGTNEPRRRRNYPTPVFRPPPTSSFDRVVGAPAGAGTHGPRNTGIDPAGGSESPPRIPIGPFVATKTGGGTQSSRKTGVNPPATSKPSSKIPVAPVVVTQTGAGRQGPRNTGVNPPAIKRVTNSPAAQTTTLAGPRTYRPGPGDPPQHEGGEGLVALTFAALRRESRQDRVVIGDILVGSRRFAVEGQITRSGALTLHRVNHDVRGAPFRHIPGSSSVRFRDVRLVGPFRACRNDQAMLKRWVVRERRP